MKVNLPVPFVDEVEEFNDLMNKPNNYEPTIPEKKNGNLYTTSSWKNLRNIEKHVNEVTSLKFWMLCVILLMFPLGTVLCYMALKIKFGQPIKRYKHQTYQKLAQLKKKPKQLSNNAPEEQGEPCHYEKLVISILFTDRVTEK
jgi:hypothetical protein